MDKLLDSKCKYNKEGVLYDDVGTFCWIWIGIIIFNNIILFIRYVNIIYHYNSINDKNNVLKHIMGLFGNLLVFFFQIYFIYSMCKLCRGFTALGIMILISCVVNVINYQYATIS